LQRKLEGAEGKLERIRAGGDADRPRCFRYRGELALEGGDLRTQHDLLGLEHSAEGGVELLPLCLIRPSRVEEADAVHQ
jgi:hypothetical protein